MQRGVNGFNDFVDVFRGKCGGFCGGGCFFWAVHSEYELLRLVLCLGGVGAGAAAEWRLSLSGDARGFHGGCGCSNRVHTFWYLSARDVAPSASLIIDAR